MYVSSAHHSLQFDQITHSKTVLFSEVQNKLSSQSRGICGIINLKKPMIGKNTNDKVEIKYILRSFLLLLTISRRLLTLHKRTACKETKVKTQNRTFRETYSCNCKIIINIWF